MHVLFEDDGQLKAGTVLADHDQSLQVEAISGKRQKIKAANVLLRFATPGPAETMTAAHALAADLDANFLWEAVGDGEFGFDDLAREYYGSHPAPAEAAAVAMLLASSPMHFYRKGKGRYRKAPPDALKAALASVERKQREETEKYSAQRRGQIGTGGREEKIRTYNFPQNRVTDHRVGLTLYNLDRVMDGDLRELIQSLQAADVAERLKQSAAAA